MAKLCFAALSLAALYFFLCFASANKLSDKTVVIVFIILIVAIIVAGDALGIGS